MTWIEAALGMPTDTRLLVGVEDEPDGAVVYVEARYLNRHTHVPEGKDADRIRAAWAGGSMGHCFIEVPSDALCGCIPSGGAA